MANKGDDTVSEIDVASGKVVRHATVGLEPDAVAVTPGGTLRPGGQLRGQLADAGVAPVPAAGAPDRRRSAAGGGGRFPPGDLALVSNYEDGTISPSPLPSLAVGTPVPVGHGAVRRRSSPRGVDGVGGGLPDHHGTPVDLVSMARGAADRVGGNPTGIAGAPGSGQAYVSGGDSVTPIDVATLVPGAALDVGTTAEALAVAPGGATAWVCGGDGLCWSTWTWRRQGDQAGRPSETSRPQWSSPGRLGLSGPGAGSFCQRPHLLSAPAGRSAVGGASRTRNETARRRVNPEPLDRAGRLRRCRRGVEEGDAPRSTTDEATDPDQELGEALTPVGGIGSHAR